MQHKPQDASASSQHRLLFASAGGEQRTMDLLPGLAKAQCPVLVMAGGSDSVTPIEDALEIVGALPREWVQFKRFARVGQRQPNHGADGPVFAIHQSDAVLDAMGAWNKGTYGKSGLGDRVKASTVDEAQARTALADVHESIDELLHYRQTLLAV